MAAMDPKKELVEVDETVIGLDRSNITHEGQIQIPDLDTDQSSDDTPVGPEPRSSSKLVNTLRERKHHAGIKIRKTLHISKASDDLDSQSPILANTADEESESRLVHNLPVPDKHTMKDFVHNPVDTVKSKVSNQGNQEVAANIAAKEISHGKEVDLINAQDAVTRATTEREKLLAIKDLSKLMKERQGTYARWSLDRHVTKVRRLPRESMVKKPQSQFTKKNSQGQLVTDWNAYGSHVSSTADKRCNMHVLTIQLLVYYANQYGGQYIGYGSNPPKPSKETIMPSIERLIVATSPFQELIMTIRRVYRWEYPSETIKYLVIYLVLWYLNLLLPGVVRLVNSSRHTS
jgi:hypothetical protein